jgi:hypothetical protein
MERSARAVSSARVRPACLLPLLLFALLAGCSGSGPKELKGGGREAYTEQDLRDDLAQFATAFAQSVSGTADEIAYGTGSRAVRRSALLWKMRLVPLMRELIADDDPQRGYLAAYALVVMMEQYFESGDGRSLFGEQQALAIEASHDLERALGELGGRFMEPEQVQRVDDEVEDLVSRFPIRGPDFVVASLDSVAAHVEQEGRFRWLIDIPMAPFRALGGVGDTPGAIREFAQVSRELGVVAEQLPEQARWQAELLAYDLEGRDTTTEALAAARSLAASAERISLAVQALPETVRGALEDSRATLAEADALARNTQDVSASLARTAEELRLGSEAWVRLLADGAAAPAPAEAGPPFDIAQWERAVREVGVAAAELRALAQDLALLTEPERVGLSATAVGAGLDDAESRAESLIDHAAWRAVQVLAIFFALLTAYRLLVVRRTMPRASS